MIGELLLLAGIVFLGGCSGVESRDGKPTVQAAPPAEAQPSPIPVPAPPVVQAPQPEVAPPLVGPKAPPREPASITASVREVAKLARAGVNEEVMLAYVQRTPDRFQLGPDDLIYLTDIGVAPAVLTAMQKKGTSQPAAAPPSPAAPPTPDAATTVVTPTYVTNPLPSYVTSPQPPPGTAVQPLPGPVPQQVSVPYFQDTLAPYGSWVQVEGYGACWRPDYTVVGGSWRPYADGGHWVWTDAGWYWVSDYPWGWATFHYGRWCSLPRHGWVWVPDTVWGPAWVCWRQSGSHCGWAPLPPGAWYHPMSGWWYESRSVGFEFGFGLGFYDFVFIPWSRFCEPRPHHFYASASHAAALYRDSAVVNRTVVGHDRSVVFEGVGRAQVAQASRSPIPQAALRETAWTGVGGTRETLNTSGNGLVLQSPRLASVSPGMGSGRWSPPASAGAPATPASAPAPAKPALASPSAAFTPANSEVLPGATSPYIPSTRFVPPPRTLGAASTAGGSPPTPAAPAGSTPPVAPTPAATGIATTAPLPSRTPPQGATLSTSIPAPAPTPAPAVAVASPRPAPQPSLPPRTAGSGLKGEVIPSAAALPVAPAPSTGFRPSATYAPSTVPRYSPPPGDAGIPRAG
ncbi:MAG TPA: hypothetical protein DCM86_15445, partial [Verrucomicrobiales bacterium]|nr:hypothetical protein [Verrucomicrobiales bacterium]